MQATEGISVQIKINEYQLSGGATIRDKTNGLAKVIFSERETLQYGYSCYNIYIGDKKVLYPTAENLIFGKSVLIKLKLKNDLVKITEIDNEETKTVIYANTEKCPDFDTYINNKTGAIGEFVICSYYIPKNLTLLEASQKVKNFPKSDEFTIIFAVFNHYGVAVFGIDKNENKETLYWANPHEDHIKKIDFYKTRDGKFSTINSLDNHVSIKYIDLAIELLRGVLSYEESKLYFLKLEKAMLFDLYSY